MQPDQHLWYSISGKFIYLLIDSKCPSQHFLSHDGKCTSLSRGLSVLPIQCLWWGSNSQLLDLESLYQWATGLLSGKFSIQTFYMHLASLCSWADWFELYWLKPLDRVSRVEANYHDYTSMVIAYLLEICLMWIYLSYIGFSTEYCKIT